jgi:hypothetical protein
VRLPFCVAGVCGLRAGRSVVSLSPSNANQLPMCRGTPTLTAELQALAAIALFGRRLSCCSAPSRCHVGCFPPSCNFLFVLVGCLPWRAIPGLAFGACHGCEQSVRCSTCGALVLGFLACCFFWGSPYPIINIIADQVCFGIAVLLARIRLGMPCLISCSRPQMLSKAVP